MLEAHIWQRKKCRVNLPRWLPRAVMPAQPFGRADRRLHGSITERSRELQRRLKPQYHAFKLGQHDKIGIERPFDNAFLRVRWVSFLIGLPAGKYRTPRLW